MIMMLPNEHMLPAQEAQRSFRLAEAFRVPPGAVAAPLWTDSPKSEFVIWGMIGGKQVFVQRLEILNLKKEKI
jgi:hypothetical protein